MSDAVGNAIADGFYQKVEKHKREIAELLDRIADLRTQLAEARRDSERLEWLGKSLMSNYPIVFDSKAWWTIGKWGDSCIRVSDDEVKWNHAYNFRHAIDKAIQAESKAEGEEVQG